METARRLWKGIPCILKSTPAEARPGITVKHTPVDIERIEITLCNN